MYADSSRLLLLGHADFPTGEACFPKRKLGEILHVACLLLDKKLV